MSENSLPNISLLLQVGIDLLFHYNFTYKVSKYIINWLGGYIPYYSQEKN